MSFIFKKIIISIIFRDTLELKVYILQANENSCFDPSLCGVEDIIYKMEYRSENAVVVRSRQVCSVVSVAANRWPLL